MCVCEWMNKHSNKKKEKKLVLGLPMPFVNFTTEGATFCRDTFNGWTDGSIKAGFNAKLKFYSLKTI